jgi:hypothetical protein
MAVVSSRLGYCKALLYGVSATNINYLERVLSPTEAVLHMLLLFWLTFTGYQSAPESVIQIYY